MSIRISEDDYNSFRVRRSPGKPQMATANAFGHRRTTKLRSRKVSEAMRADLRELDRQFLHHKFGKANYWKYRSEIVKRYKRL